VENDASFKLQGKYRDIFSRIKNVKLCERLAEYNYYDMDVAVAHALKVSKAVWA
jgi:UDP-galactopyranose mutase